MYLPRVGPLATYVRSSGKLLKTSGLPKYQWNNEANTNLLAFTTALGGDSSSSLR